MLATLRLNFFDGQDLVRKFNLMGPHSNPSTWQTRLNTELSLMPIRLYTKGKRKHFQLCSTIYFDTPCISNYSINCWTRVRYEVHVNDSQTIPTIFAIFNECWKWVFALCHETLVCLTCMHLLIIINSNYENWINLQVRRRMENSIEEEVRYKQ